MNNGELQKWMQHTHGTNIIYNEPADVIPIFSTVAILSNAYCWAESRGLTKQTFDAEALHNNLLSEDEEFLQGLSILQNAMAESDRDLIQKGLHEIIDAVYDKLIYFTVDVFKMNSPITEHQWSVFAQARLEELSLITYADFKLCIEGIEETFREIATRRGRYDESIGKWVKESSTTPYKADYSNLIKGSTWIK